MSSLALKSEPRAEQVRCTDDELVVVLTDGRTLSVPLAWFPRLAHASTRQRSKYELLGNGSGIHWPIADEDISVSELLAGKPSIEMTASAPNKPLKARRAERRRAL